MKRLRKILLWIVAGLVVLCLAGVLISGLSNLGLPTHSTDSARLSALDKARVEEVLHLRSTLGGQVWPGWEKADIAIILYNEDYAFLIGEANPTYGWKKVPNGEPRGGAWEPVSGDTFQGQVYFRQRLTDPKVTPEAFIVQVGDRWAASFGTREYAQIGLTSGFRKDLPGPLQPIFPYRLLWQLLMGDTDTYIGALEHEAFHAYQGIAAPQRLAQAEQSMQTASRYPWDNPASETAWQAELDRLLAAVRAGTDAQAVELARQFLALRDQRRAANQLDASLVDMERGREWEEGLAKYAELAIQRQAALSKDYTPVSGLSSDKDFKNYKTRLGLWDNQLNEINRLSGRKEDTRFYYSGFGLAVLLDRLAPGWKDQAFKPGIWLEDLLRQVVK
jgi:hypothetical protein